MAASRQSWIHSNQPDGESIDINERQQSLQTSREDIQKRAFSKWVNASLRGQGAPVVDLFIDMSDGSKLIQLLKHLSKGELLAPSRGRLRIHKLQNVGVALNFLRASKVKLENMIPESIVDGSPRLILGLVWTIIHKFQMQEIKLEGDAKSARDALLYWCQKVTQGYKDVKIINFTTSWKDGLGFNAIIHAFRYFNIYIHTYIYIYIYIIFSSSSSSRRRR